MLPPQGGAFYEIVNSPWHLELLNTKVHFLEDTKHFVFCFYDEVVEVIAPSIRVEQFSQEDINSLKKL